MSVENENRQHSVATLANALDLGVSIMERLNGKQLSGSVMDNDAVAEELGVIINNEMRFQEQTNAKT